MLKEGRSQSLDSYEPEEDTREMLSEKQTKAHSWSYMSQLDHQYLGIGTFCVHLRIFLTLESYIIWQAIWIEQTSNVSSSHCANANTRTSISKERLAKFLACHVDLIPRPFSNKGQNTKTTTKKHNTKVCCLAISRHNLFHFFQNLSQNYRKADLQLMPLAICLNHLQDTAHSSSFPRHCWQWSWGNNPLQLYLRTSHDQGVEKVTRTVKSRGPLNLLKPTLELINVSYFTNTWHIYNFIQVLAEFTCVLPLLFKKGLLR